MRSTFAATNEIIMKLFRTINTFISIQFGQTDITVSSLEFLNFNLPIDVTEILGEKKNKQQWLKPLWEMLTGNNLFKSI